MPKKEQKPGPQGRDIFAEHAVNLERANAAQKGEEQSQPTAVEKVIDNGADDHNLSALYQSVAQDVIIVSETPRDERVAAKIALLDKYREALAQVISEPIWQGNLFIFWNIVWLFDVGSLREAWELSKQGFAKHLETDGEIFKSDFKNFVAKTIVVETQHALLNKAKPSDVFWEMFNLVEENALIVADVRQAEMLKIAAIHLEDSAPAKALEFLERAEAIYPEIHVKGRIKRLKAVIGG